MLQQMQAAPSRLAPPPQLWTPPEQRIMRPSLRQSRRVLEETPIEAAGSVQKAAGFLTSGVASAAGYELADIPNQHARWDMVLSTVTTTTGGDVTDVEDLVGSADLGSGFSGNDPADVTSDATLNGRRACAHVRASSESLATSVLVNESGYTVWIIGYLANVTASHGLWGEKGAAYAGGGMKNATPDVWFMSDGAGTDWTSSTTTPTANTSYFFCFTVGSTAGNSEIYINNVDQNIPDGGSWTNPGALAEFEIGYQYYNAFFSDLTWTAAGITTDIMAADVRADVEQWRVDKAS